MVSVEFLLDNSFTAAISGKTRVSTGTVCLTLEQG